MKATITRTCGHSTPENLFGSSKDRESKIRWLKTQPCMSCKRAGQTTQATAQAEGLPALTGSEKQIEWALRIRAEKLAAIATLRSEFEAQGQRQNVDAQTIAGELGKFDAAVSRLQSNDSASWWIDHRNTSAQPLLAVVA